MPRPGERSKNDSMAEKGIDSLKGTEVIYSGGRESRKAEAMKNMH